MGVITFNRQLHRAERSIHVFPCSDECVAPSSVRPHEGFALNALQLRSTCTGCTTPRLCVPAARGEEVVCLLPSACKRPEVFTHVSKLLQPSLSVSSGAGLSWKHDTWREAMWNRPSAHRHPLTAVGWAPYSRVGEWPCTVTREMGEGGALYSRKERGCSWKGID